MFPLSVKCWPTPVKTVSGCAATGQNAARGKRFPCSFKADGSTTTVWAPQRRWTSPPATRRARARWCSGPGSTAATAGTTCTPYPFPPEHCGLIWICCIRNGSTTSCGAKKTAGNRALPWNTIRWGKTAGKQRAAGPWKTRMAHRFILVKTERCSPSAAERAGQDIPMTRRTPAPTSST